MHPPTLRAAAERADASLQLHTLSNGVRVLVLHRPDAVLAGAAVYVRSGSAHEARAASGICHVIEHMAFKGTARRDARRINLDAEQRGAEVDAHTDKDHSAYRMQGLGADLPDFIALLGELVLEPTFPADELERERRVLLQEAAEVDDDPMALAYTLFDRACWGLHPAAQPVIGSKALIERVGPEQLLAHVRRQHTGANLVLAVTGPLAPEAVLRAAEAALGHAAPGSLNAVALPAWRGGLKSRQLDLGAQAHLVLGFPLPPPGPADTLHEMAAAVLGEGMSSPLLHRLREQQGLVYHATAASDVYAHGGQLVVEATTAPERLDTLVDEAARLFAALAARAEPQETERARRQLLVRRLRMPEQPMRRLEDAALELFALGRVRPLAERLDELHAVDAGAVRDAFARMVAAGPAAALVGTLRRAAGERARDTLAARLPVPGGEPAAAEVDG